MNLIIDMVCGQCPVEGEGTLNGEPFYFRARGSRWTFSVGDDPVGNPRAEYCEKYSDDKFAAGWMTEVEARAFIERAAKIMTGTP